MGAIWWGTQQGRIKGGGQRGQLPRAPRCKGAPRDEMYLFQIKYSFEKFRNSEAIQEYNSILYSDMLRYVSRGQGPPAATDLSTNLTVCQF